MNHGPQISENLIPMNRAMTGASTVALNTSSGRKMPTPHPRAIGRSIPSARNATGNTKQHSNSNSHLIRFMARESGPPGPDASFLASNPCNPLPRLIHPWERPLLALDILALCALSGKAVLPPAEAGLVAPACRRGAGVPAPGLHGGAPPLCDRTCHRLGSARANGPVNNVSLSSHHLLAPNGRGGVRAVDASRLSLSRSVLDCGLPPLWGRAASMPPASRQQPGVATRHSRMRGLIGVPPGTY